MFLTVYGLQAFAAYLLDLILGDPRQIPHPVVLIGKSIVIIERIIRHLACTPAALYFSGFLMAFIIIAGTWLATYFLVSLAYSYNILLGSLLSIWFIYNTIAARSLADAAYEIYYLLINGKLEEARFKVRWIVGRDSENMDETEITRATVETVAENTVDGVVAPLLFALIGGAPLAMAYRAINTLDSMVGYKDERYIHFGKFSARLDDLVNYIPARVTGLLQIFVAFILKMDAKRSYSIIRRDAHKHPSPNSGIPESAVAGALGVRLGGFNYYQGIKSFRSYMGDDLNPLKPIHIVMTVRMMYFVSFIVALSGIIITFVLYQMNLLKIL